MDLKGRKARYREFLKSDFWRELTAEKKRLVGRCERCKRRVGLQSHHKFYREDWFQTKLDDLIVLCRRCHGREHGFIVAYNGIMPFRNDRRFSEVVHRCGCLIRMVQRGVPLRERDNRFLELALKEFPPTAKDSCVGHKVGLVRMFELVMREARK